MAICVIHYMSVPHPFYGGQGRAMSWCTTHRMEVVPDVQTQELCPLGRIEQATDHALARIVAALEATEQALGKVHAAIEVLNADKG
jgi:hypothetical protein